MTTVAHNTLVVDERSHFGGDYAESMKHHSDILFADFSREGVQVVSARESNACPGVTMQRTVAYVTTPFLQYPLILDLLRAESDTEHRYDYPMWYCGQPVSVDFPYEKARATMTALGEAEGYRHLWKEAWGRNTEGPSSCFTWIRGDRFYSLTTATTPDTEMVFAQTGADDPDFNLRTEKVYMLRERAKRNHTFFSSLETHGTYDLQVEQSDNLVSSCRGVRLLCDTPDYTVALAEYDGGHRVVLCLANRATGAGKHHKAVTSEGTFEWTGPCDIRID